MGRKRSGGAEAVWRQRLARFHSGELTVAEFCRREGVSDPSFYQWRKRLQQGGGRPKRTDRGERARPEGEEAGHFVPVHVIGLTAAEIELPNGIKIRVPATSAEALRTAILSAGDACRAVAPC
jgi:transposase-like protein